MYTKETSKKINAICDLVIAVSQFTIAIALIIWVLKNA